MFPVVSLIKVLLSDKERLLRSVGHSDVICNKIKSKLAQANVSIKDVNAH